MTGALVLPNSFCFARFFLLHAPPFSVLLSFCLTLVLRNMPLYCCVCAVLLLLVCPVLLFLCCPVVLVSSCFLWRRGLVVSVGLVLLAVLVRASVFPVLPALPCCASCLCFSSSPAPRVVFFLLWSSSHSCVLVPPSEYLVAAVTALLPCFLAGSVVLLCFPFVIRFMATKASCPVWGVHPLHHVTGGVGELSSAILRHSP